jgi:hypothetical protein
MCGKSLKSLTFQTIGLSTRRSEIEHLYRDLSDPRRAAEKTQVET